MMTLKNFKKIEKCQSYAFLYFYFKMRIKLTWYWEVCSFHLPFLCYRLRNKVQCSEQSQMPIFSKISDKVATASYRRSKNWESKGHSRRMQFTLGNATVKATKAKRSTSNFDKIEILLSREDAWNNWLIPLNEDILPEKNFTYNQRQSRCKVIHFNSLWTSLFPIKSGEIIQLMIYLPRGPYQKYGQGF